ncbi:MULTISPECIES: helix-turn-helix domain-containing protein [Cetobacterium]|uniref:XRE family transcriptional regulator n=1 Tax=Candidatus Cetobacterium colombiensis TaxID=3073100 RepID=A0ABU4W6H3_9FUSO|nr:XRE family transcriptional regulator [Candidatus Cetobacterium colombiensis]MDX8335128.1 XRE family transcriptional regulator [Candidatus Cetobacterium colombiensis]
MDEINLGLKIKKFRTDKNLSLKELAQKINSTSALLSQIEKGVTNPSINTLNSLSKALDIPLYRFFLKESLQKVHIVRAKDRKIIKPNKEEGISYEVLSPEPQTHMEFMILNLEAHSTSKENEIGHDGQEVAFILEGEVQLNTEEKSFTLFEGDSIKIEKFVKHNWSNITSKNAKVIFAVTI